MRPHVPPGVARRRSALAAAPVLLSALALTVLAAEPKPGTDPLLVFYSVAAGERSVEAQDLIFVHFETRYVHRAAPRSETPSGERLEIVERRMECRCVRLADYSKVKMSKIRELAFSYPPGSRVARVRLTLRNGQVREYPANELYGGDGLFPPRFAATIEGVHREFPLVLESDADEDWPEESLSRILLVRTKPQKR